MGEDRVERFRAKSRLMDVTNLEVEVGHAARESSGRLDYARRRVDADRLARCHALRQTGGDGPRPAAHIEQTHPRLKKGQEKCGGHLRSPSGMVGDHRGVMAMLVDGAIICRFGHPHLLALRARPLPLQAFRGLSVGTSVRQKSRHSADTRLKARRSPLLSLIDAAEVASVRTIHPRPRKVVPLTIQLPFGLVL